MSQPESFVESFNNSTVTGFINQIGGHFQANDEKQNEMMMKLMENVVRLSERVIEMMGEER